MIKHLTIILLLAVSANLSGQSARDFTITDYNNNIHELFADYLDQDVVVLLKIMFVDCPPCNSIAPDVEDLYQEYGGAGNGDVEFIELSNKSWDSNQDVKGYAQKHGITFIGAGNDGGSVTAANKYTDGTYGPFYGTPTFIVIAPDKTVHYRVPFNQIKPTIDEILEPTTYSPVNGFVTDKEGKGMNNVAILLHADQVDTIAKTNITGYFQFDPNTLTFDEHSYLSLYFDTGKHGNGISTRDLILILKHILGIELFTEQIDVVASDINLDGNVTAKDLVEIRKFILGKYVQFPYPGFTSHVIIHEQENQGTASPQHFKGTGKPFMLPVANGEISPNFIGGERGNLYP